MCEHVWYMASDCNDHSIQFWYKLFFAVLATSYEKVYTFILILKRWESESQRSKICLLIILDLWWDSEESPSIQIPLKNSQTTESPSGVRTKYDSMTIISQGCVKNPLSPPCHPPPCLDAKILFNTKNSNLFLFQRTICTLHTTCIPVYHYLRVALICENTQCVSSLKVFHL